MAQQGQISNAEAARIAEQAAKAAADAAANAAGSAAARAQSAAQGVGVAPIPSQAELARLSYSQLQRRLEMLRSQRSDIASRRQNLAESYEQASGASKEGIASRLQVLDNNIVLYEAEIGAVGRAMAEKAPTRDASTTQPSGSYYNDGDMFGAAFSSFLATALLAVFIARRYIRRNYGRMNQKAQPNMIQSNERLDRIEQAVDTIAVEIERVSENQRFMTRLMTETKLGDTLKDVRKSTELAKEAAG